MADRVQFMVNVPALNATRLDAQRIVLNESRASVCNRAMELGLREMEKMGQNGGRIERLRAVGRRRGLSLADLVTTLVSAHRRVGMPTLEALEDPQYVMPR